MEIPYLFLLLFSIFSFSVLARSQYMLGNSSSVALPQGGYSMDQCDCYLVSGPDPGYFQHYQFWDFRKAPLPRDFAQSDAQEPGDDDEEDETIHDSVFGSNAVLLSNSSFAEDWTTQNWARLGTAQKPIPILNSVDNIFFARDPPSTNLNGDTYLVLRTMRLENHTSAAELESRLNNVFHSSLRVRLRLLPYGNAIKEPPQEPTPKPNQAIMNPGGPPKGACAGIFMYHSSDCETDIEILTGDPPNIVHYANQPDYDPATDTAIPGASIIAAIPTPWTEWSTHRIDWHANLSVWYVDNLLQGTKTYSVPDRPSTPVINLWSDGGEWSGDMQVGESVFMGIEWIQLVYNVSDTPGPNHPIRGLGRAPKGVSFDDEGDSLSGEADEADIAKERKNKKQKDKGKHKEKEKNQTCHRPCWID